MVKACILGCSGLELTHREAEFFRRERPLGFILFGRNIDNPEQVKRLVADLKASAGHANVLVLIDQEGGRVQRLKAPHWPAYPAAGTFARVSNDVYEQRELVRLSARLMAADLHELGINVDCAPVLDVPLPGGHDIVGDRGYGFEAETVAVMGRAACEGLLAGGVLPVIKHMPGHGRAVADSHHDLPVVTATRQELEAIDFLPFEVNADMPLGMTAHIVYTAHERKHPATASRKMIRLIRQKIGFEGLLFTDDLSMNALSGTMTDRVKAARAAGCDVMLHCNGKMEEMEAVVAHSPRLRGVAQKRFEAAWGRLNKRIEPINIDEARLRLQQALSRVDKSSPRRTDPTEAFADTSLAVMRELGGV